MYNPQVHYRALFSIEKAPTSKFDHIFKVLVFHIGKWLQGHSVTRNEHKNILKPWFYHGGRLLIRNDESWIEVQTDEYDTDSRTAPHWVMRFEHSDSTYKQRKWRTDISLHSYNSVQADFSITVTWFLERDYLGEQPPVPISSVPRFVTKILSDETLICSIGNKRIKTVPTYLSAGDGRPLFQFINSPDRIVPVILMNFQFLKNLISPDELQKNILGSGIVYWYDSPIVHNELNYDWGGNAERYSCGRDAIRIYLPNVNTDYWSDSRRHRFFYLSSFKQDIELMEIISQSVFRVSSRNIHDNIITNLEELYIHQQKRKLTKLRIATATLPRSQEELEYIAALEDENTQVIGKVKALELLLNEREEKSTYLQLELEDSQRLVSTLQKQFSDFSKAEAHYKQFVFEQTDILKPFNKLPRDLVDVLKLCAELFPHNMVILDAAYESAKEAKFNFIHEAYDLLFNMGTILCDLLFINNEGDIEKEFKQTGYDLSMKESSNTNADKKLMELRKRTYDGEEYYFNPHAKLSKSGKDLRIHFIADQMKKVIVIGHCGDHLRTAGTTRRKEA